MTWPGHFFFKTKVAQGLPQKVSQNPAALRAAIFSLSAKNSGKGCTNPPVRARAKVNFKIWSEVNMTEISVVAYQMTRVDETNMLVSFSLKLLHSAQVIVKNARTGPSKTGPGAAYMTR